MNLRRLLPPLAVLWTAAVVWATAFQCFRYFSPALAGAGPIPWSGAAVPAVFIHLLRGAWVLLFLLAAYGAGDFVLSRFKKSAPFLSVGAGLVLWSWAGLALALAGLSGRTPLRWATLLLAAPAAWWGFRRLRGASLPRPVLTWSTGSLAVLGVFYGAAAMVPETFGDVLHYILPSAELFLRDGRWGIVPGLSGMGFPAAAATLYMWPLAWADERLARLLNVAVGFLWVGAVAGWTARRWGKEAAGWAALFLAANPLFGLYAWSATAEILCGFFVFLAFTHWEEGDRESILAAALFLGAAAAMKYTALLLAPFFLIDALRRVAREKWPASLLACAAVLVFLPMLPWWALNLAAFDNPVFPYLTGFFSTGTESQRAQWAMMFADQRGPESFPGRFVGFFAAAVRGIWDGRAGFIGFLPLALLPGLPLLWRAGPPDSRRAGARLSAALLAVVLVFTAVTGRVRFFLPFLGLLAAAGGAAGAAAFERLGAWARVLRAALAAGLALQAAAVALILHLFLDGFAVITGGEKSADFLRRPHGAAYQAPPQGAYDWLRANAGPTDKAYLLGDYRAYRAPIPVYANTLYDVPLYALSQQAGETPAQFVDSLRRGGYTYLMFNRGFFLGAVAGQFASLDWTRRLDAVFALLPPPVYRDAWTLVFAIPPSIN